MVYKDISSNTTREEEAAVKIEIQVDLIDGVIFYGDNSLGYD
jgi:hypothetical protein